MNDTPTIFWILAPFLLIFMISMPFLIPVWNVSAVITMISLESLSLLVFIGLFNPEKFHFAWRGVGLIIFLAYISYAIIMLIESKGAFTIPKRRSETNVFNALLGLIVFGIPGLSYAIFGRLTFWKDSDASDDEKYE